MASLPKLIINLAGTGMVPTQADNPSVPITPSEIAEDCARSCALGASILHLHARDEEGRPTWRPELYRDIIQRVRQRCPDAVVCVSTSGRTRLASSAMRPYMCSRRVRKFTGLMRNHQRPLSWVVEIE